MICSWYVYNSTSGLRLAQEMHHKTDKRSRMIIIWCHHWRLSLVLYERDRCAETLMYYPRTCYEKHQVPVVSSGSGRGRVSWMRSAGCALPCHAINLRHTERHEIRVQSVVREPHLWVSVMARETTLRLIVDGAQPENQWYDVKSFSRLILLIVEKTGEHSYRNVTLLGMRYIILKEIIKEFRLSILKFWTSTLLSHAGLKSTKASSWNHKGEKTHCCPYLLHRLRSRDNDIHFFSYNVAIFANGDIVKINRRCFILIESKQVIHRIQQES